MTYLLGTQGQPDFLRFWVNVENAILNLVSPEKLVTTKILHPIVGRNELSYTGVSNVAQILFRVVPRLGRSDLEQTCGRKNTLEQHVVVKVDKTFDHFLRRTHFQSKS